jgi:hypothetical protein
MEEAWRLANATNAEPSSLWVHQSLSFLATLIPLGEQCNIEGVVFPEPIRVELQPLPMPALTGIVCIHREERGQTYTTSVQLSSPSSLSSALSFAPPFRLVIPPSCMVVVVLGFVLNSLFFGIGILAGLRDTILPSPLFRSHYEPVHSMRIAKAKRSRMREGKA